MALSYVHSMFFLFSKTDKQQLVLKLFACQQSTINSSSSSNNNNNNNNICRKECFKTDVRPEKVGPDKTGEETKLSCFEKVFYG